MTKIDPTPARQGSKGNRVLIILIAALALALVAFLGMGLFGASQPDENIGTGASGISTEPAAPASTSGGSGVVTPSATPPAPSPTTTN